jgi:hypothetical protein
MTICPLNTGVEKFSKSSIYDQHKVDIVPGCASCIHFHLLTLTSYRVTKIKPETEVK